MKFGVSSYVWVSPFSNHTIEQLKHAKELGFDIYEIGVEDPSSFDPAYVKLTRQVYRLTYAEPLARSGISAQTLPVTGTRGWSISGR